jgi:hypothetical protein
MVAKLLTGLAGAVLELATALIAFALLLVFISSYMTARVLGVTPDFNRTSALMQLARDVIAVGLAFKPAGDTSWLNREESDGT